MHVYIFQQKYEQNINNHPKREDFSYILQLIPKNAHALRRKNQASGISARQVVEEGRII